jgi:hypothetical protein
MPRRGGVPSPRRDRVQKVRILMAIYNLACLGQTHEIEHVAGYKDPVLPESELEHLTIREAEATAIANVDRINEVVLAQAKRNPWRHVLIEQ